MTATKMPGIVVYKEKLAGTTWILGIELKEVINFIPGQFVSLKVNDEGLRRSYSVASLPGGKKIDLVVDVSPMGKGSQYILGLHVGDEVEVLGFLGKFVVNESVLETQKELVFVGTGTGIAPLKPMIEDLLINKNYKGNVTLIWGMRYETDLYWQKEIGKMERDYDNFHFNIALSKPMETWPGVQGHVGDVVEKIDLLGGETSAFLCGNPEMIMEIKEKLLDKGVPETQILYERFA
jgi:NAD(P)H-flavin reductase